MSAHREPPARMPGDAPARLERYRVTLGHVTVTVEGRTEEDALRRARRALCVEMPRLWDVIERSEPGRFGVHRLP